MEARKRKKTQEQIVGSAVENIFKKYDQNHDNYIDFTEFCKMIEDLNLSLPITHKELAHIFQLVDVNGDGRVTRKELVNAFLSIKSSNC